MLNSFHSLFQTATAQIIRVKVGINTVQVELYIWPTTAITSLFNSNACSVQMWACSMQMWACSGLQHSGADGAFIQATLAAVRLSSHLDNDLNQKRKIWIQTLPLIQFRSWVMGHPRAFSPHFSSLRIETGKWSQYRKRLIGCNVCTVITSRDTSVTSNWTEPSVRSRVKACAGCIAAVSEQINRTILRVKWERLMSLHIRAEKQVKQVKQVLSVCELFLDLIQWTYAAN